MTRAFALVFCLLLPTAVLSAADLKVDGLVKPAEVKLLAGKPASLQFMNGTIVGDVTIIDFINDRNAESIRFVQYQDGQRKPRMKSSDLYRLIIAGRPYAFRYYSPTKGRFLIDLDKAKADAEKRMQGADRELREPQTQEEMTDAVAEQMKIFDDARKKLAPLQFNLAESKFAIVFTDYPLPLANQLAFKVDTMCQQMNEIFGLPETANIWSGKMLVAVFSQRVTFGDFEAEVLNNHNFGTNTLIYHTNSSRFLVAMYQKQLNARSARGISWSMAGGYIGRYRSNAQLPKWFHTGLQSNLNRILFPDPATDVKENKKVADHLRHTGSLLGILEATELGKDRGHLARLLVAHLMNSDPTAFSQFFEDLKLGHTWQDALKTNYGVTPEQFALAFGRKAGVPALKP